MGPEVGPAFQRRSRDTPSSNPGVRFGGNGVQALFALFAFLSRVGARALGSQDSGAGVARAWRGLQAFFCLGGAGVARAWRGRGAGMSCDPWELRPSRRDPDRRKRALRARK
eukprot:gene11271-biopygen19870